MQCAYFDAGKCRSCTLMGTPYDAQVASKQAKVSAMLPEGDFWAEPFCGPESGFRNKAKLAVGRKGRSGPYQLGILAPGKGVQDLTACGLYEAPVRAAFAPIRRALTRTDLKPYDPATHKGQLRTVIVSANPAGHLQVRFVCRTAASIVPLRRALAGLQAELPQLVAASINLHPEHVALLEGAEEVPLTEGARLTMPVGVDLQLDRRSFFQTNTTVARGLYAQARDWAGTPDGKAWDLYCGVGGFALTLAKAGWEVAGVEAIDAAIACARDAATAQGLHARFETGDATEWALAQTEKPALVVVNPPRRGIGKKLATALTEGGARRILYSSCNPKTLAKDLQVLSNYRLRRARLFDMFPQTNHAEVLVELLAD